MSQRGGLGTKQLLSSPVSGGIAKVMASDAQTAKREMVEMALSSSALRAANLTMGLLFLAGGYVQLNDPDWLPWVMVWVLPAALCLVAAWSGSVSVDALQITALAVSLVAGTIAKAAIKGVQRHGFRFDALAHVEECREGAGLAIIAAWMAFLYVASTATMLPTNKSNWTLSSITLLAVASAAPVALSWAWFKWVTILKAGQLSDLPGHCETTFI